MSDDEATAAVAGAYRAHYRQLVATIYAMTGDHGEAADAVQEAFAVALDRPARFMAVGDPRAWLCVVALNIVQQRLRRRAVFDRLVRLGRVDASPDAVPGLSAEHVDVARALRKLTRPVREVVVLHHLLDLPVAVVAEQLGVPEGTVKARLVRGRARLSELLDPDTASTAAAIASK